MACPGAGEPSRPEASSGISGASQPLTSSTASTRPVAALPPQDAEFYAGGKKHPLWSDRGWIAVKVSEPARLEAVASALAALPEASPVRKAEVHRPAGLILQPLHGTLSAADYTSLAEKAAAISGVSRVLGTYINGKLLPIIEMEEICVQFPPETGRNAATSIVEAHGAVLLRPLGSYAPNSYLIKLRPETKGGSIAVANALYETGVVLFSHTDFLWPKQLRYIPNDPLYTEQQHLNNTGQGGGTVAADIRAERAWDITRGSSSVIVGVVDDSLEINHPDLKGTNHLTGHWDYRDNDADPSPVVLNGGFDAQNFRIWGDNHGTSVAGVIGAIGNNKIGVTGVAPGCKLMGVRLTGGSVFACGTLGTLQIEAASLAHAKNNGAAVINCSWGPADRAGPNQSTISQPIPDCVSAAINDAVNNGRGGKGCVICWAAGNGNEDVDLDGYASHPNVVCVAASSHLDVKASYSDFGDAIDVCAPGGERRNAPIRGIFTTDVRGSQGYRETSGTAGNYTNATDLSGTSFATPVVAGVAALIISKEPNLTWSQVRDRLRLTADKIDTANGNYDGNGHSQQYGHGRVNAHKALAASDNAVPFVLYRNLTEGAVFTNLSAVEGETGDNGLGVWRIKTVLRDEATGKWWNWTAGGTGTWTGTTYVDAEHARLAPPQSAGSWASPLPPLSSGTYTVQVLAIDHADNESPWNGRTFIIDGTGPSMTTTQPVQSRNYSNPLTAMGEAFDNVTEKQFALRSVDNQQWYHWTASGFTAGDFNAAQHTHSIVNTDRAWSLVLPVLAPGSYELHNSARDTLGRWSGWQSYGFRIDSLPTVKILNPGNNSHVTDFDFVLGTFTDPGAVGIEDNQVNFTLYNDGEYWNGSAWTTTQTTLHASIFDQSWAYPDVPDVSNRSGTFAISASISNNLGESSLPVSGVSNVIFRVDNTPPQTAVTLPANGTTITTNGPLTFSGTASDGAGEIDRVVLFIRRNSDNLYWNGSGWIENALSANLLTTFNAGSGAWICTHPLPVPGGNYSTQMTNGSYNFIALAFDKAGLTRQADSVVTVDFHQTYTWTGATLRDTNPNNNSNSWGTPDNWSPIGVPDTADVAIIANGDRVDSSISRTVYGLRLGAGHLKFTNGPGENGTLTTTNASTWTGGAFSGQWDNVQGAVITVSGAGAYKDLGTAGAAGLLNNAGTLRWVGGSWQLRGYGGDGPATINNLATGEFDIAGNGVPLYHISSPTNLVFNNHGRIVKSAGAGGTYLDTNHLWTLNLESGSIFENAVADPAALLYRSGGGAVTNVKAGAIFRGPGRIHFSGGTPLNAESGAWTIDNAATLELAGMVLACPQTGSLTLEPSADAALRWTAGAIHGNLVIPADATLTVTGLGAYKDLGAAGLPGTIHNSGIITWTGESTAWELRGYGGSGPATINNLATGVFDIAGNGQPLYHINATNLIFNNDGRIIKSAGTGTTGFDNGNLWVLNNSTGAFIENAVAGSVLQRNGANAITNIADGPNFSGPGTIRFGGGTPLNAVAGTWNIAGDATLHLAGMVLRCPQTGSLTLQPSVNSTLRWTSGTIHGNLVIPAAATLEVTAAGAYKDLGAADLPATLTNRGTIRWTGGSWQLRGFGGTGAVTINNETTGVFDIAGTGTPLYHVNPTNLVFNNRGRIVKSLGDGGTYLDVNHLWTLNLETGSVLENAVADAASVLYRSGGGAVTNVKAGAIFRGPGRINFGGGTPLNAENGTWHLQGAPLELAGMVLNCPQTGSLKFQPTDTAPITWSAGTIHGNLEILPGTTLHVTGAGAYKDLGAATLPATLINRGTVRWTEGSWQLRGYGGTGPATINNETTGVFDIAGNGAPLYHISSPANLVFNNRGRIVKSAGAGGTYLDTNHLWTLNLETGSVLENAVADPASVLYRSGGGAVTNVKAGTIFRGPGRIHFAGGTPLNATETGAWNLTGGVPFELAGMTLNCPATGGLTLQATGGAAVSWTAGTITGILNISTGTALTVTGNGNYKDLGAAGQPGILNNAGTLTWTNGWPIRGYGGTGAATLHNQSGGVLHLASSGNVFYHQTPTGNTLINSGSMHVGASPGVVDGTWSFTQTPTGILNIEIAGPAAADYDRLAFGGTATLGGSVSVTKLNSYAPAEGTTFPFLTAGTVSGTFGIVTGGFSAEYTGTSATLRAVAAGLTFADWLVASGFTPAEIANPLISGPNADPDGDGQTNFFEYVHNTNPKTAGTAPETAGTANIGGQDYLTLKYRRWADREAAGVTYTPETGSSLGGWNTAGIIEEVDPAAPVIPGSTACRCRVLISPAVTKFLRVKAAKP